MKYHSSTMSIKLKTISYYFLAVMVLGSLFSLVPVGTKVGTPKASAACLPTAPPTTYGKVTQSVTVATAGTYRVWSRIKAPNTTANSYYFQVDTGCAYNVGDSTSIPANTWKWVNYQDGSTATPIDVTLTAGAHNLVYTGKEADVQLDKVMLLGDTTCVPSDVSPSVFGSNCAVTDTISPTVSITAPTSGSTVSGAAVNIAANAADAVGVTRVDFLVDGVVKGNDTTAAYAYSWNTSTVTNGAHTLTAKAYDAAGNVGTSTAVSVTVNNTETTPPTAPTGLTAPSKTATSVSLAWTASTDNVGVAGYRVFRGTTQVGTPTTTSYTDTGLTASTAYSYTVKAIDAAGNLSAASTALAVTTNAATDTTAPTVSITAPANGATVNFSDAIVPDNFKATAADNTGGSGLAKVEFYDGTTLLGTDTSSPYSWTWTTTTAGAHSLRAKAFDNAGNSTNSAIITVTATISTVKTPGDCAGGTNGTGDGRVNALDLGLLITHDNTSYPACDFTPNNGTSVIGAADMAVLIANWTW
jgi:chitodextrinase